MARKPRIKVADVIYHVTSRGVERRAIFDVVTGDRELFLALLAAVVVRYGWRVHAYCSMGNHFHLVVETPDANLAVGMQFLKGQHAIWFELRCVESGARKVVRAPGQLGVGAIISPRSEPCRRRGFSIDRACTISSATAFEALPPTSASSKTGSHSCGSKPSLEICV
jgi:transposase IS200 family protein